VAQFRLSKLAQIYLAKLAHFYLTVTRVLNEGGKTKKIVVNQFKSIKSQFMFKPEFSLLRIEKSKTDPNDIKVVDCPFSLFLKSLTLTEFGEILNQILVKIDLFSDWTVVKN
jgi:hypothetical protein